MGATPATEPNRAINSSVQVSQSTALPKPNTMEVSTTPTVELAATGTSQIAPSRPSIRLCRGPLSATDRSAVLAEYACATEHRVTIQTFARWAEQGAEGPALHALLQAADRHIVGHCCLVPFRMYMRGRAWTVAVPQYFFVSAKYRSDRAWGLEASNQPIETALLTELYAQATKLGWGPIFIYPDQGESRFHRAAGCRTVRFTARECVFTLNPAQAWRSLPALSLHERTKFVLSLVAQQGFSRCVMPFLDRNGVVRSARIGERIEVSRSRPDHSLTLSEDEEFLEWRYPHGLYSRILVADGSDGYAITRKGLPYEELRVSQWRAPGDRYFPALVKELIRQGDVIGTAAVRWCVYGHGSEQDRIVKHLRKQHFYCTKYSLRALVYSSNPDFLAPENWSLSDSLVAFPS
jgi:hypothetical protein